MIQNKLKKVSNFLFFALICLTNPAFASPSFWTPPADDASINFLLNRFFGKAMPNIGLNLTEGNDPFSNMFSFFNAAILTVGCLFIAYTLIVGTMQTAHEGEMLGKQWSSMWIPIRTAMGVGLVVPLSSGYCTAQLLVMWLAVQGVGLADELWKFFVNGTMANNGLLMSIPSPKSVEMAKEVLKINTCLEGLRHISQKNNSIAQFSMEPQNGQYPRKVFNSNLLGTKTFKQKYTGYGYTTGGAPGLKEYKVKVGNETRSVKHFSQDAYTTTEASQSICGFSKRELFQTTASPGGANAWGGAGAVAGGKLGSSIAPGIGTAIGGAAGAVAGGVIGKFIFGANFINSTQTGESPLVTEAHDNALAQMIANLTPTAEKLIKNDEAVDAKDFDNAILTYNKMVEDALMQKFNKDFSADFTENAVKQGWIMAGAWFARISALINLINKEANALPEVHFNSNGIATLPNEFTENINKGILRSTNVFNQSALSNSYTLGLSTQVLKDINAGKVNEIADENDKGIVEKFIKAFTEIDILHLRYDTRHPMITIQELGVSMLQWIATGILALVGVGIATAVGGGTLAALIGPLLGIIVFIGIGAAITMAVYVPIMPFILFLGASLSWVIMVFEAMIAAPLWAVMHLAPGGNDIMGNARQGYQLLLALLLRPALLIFGFAAAVIIIYPFGMLLNSVFFETFIISQGEGGKGLYSFVLSIGATAVYAGVLLKFLHKAFDLIHIVPDQLLKWIGGATSSDMGSTASKLNEGGNTAIVAVGQHSHQAGQTIARAPMDYKQAKGAQDAAKHQQKATEDQLVKSADEAKINSIERGQEANSALTEATQSEKNMGSNPSIDSKLDQMNKNSEAASKLDKSAAANGKIANGMNNNPSISQQDRDDAKQNMGSDLQQSERLKDKNKKLFSEISDEAKNIGSKADLNQGDRQLQIEARNVNQQAANAARLVGDKGSADNFNKEAERFDKRVSSLSSSLPPSASDNGGGGPRDSGNASSQTQSKPPGKDGLEDTKY